MAGLVKDLRGKIMHKVQDKWVDMLCLFVPVVGTYQCAPGLSCCAGEAPGLEQRNPPRARLLTPACPTADAPV
jgi:hypothetical protein